MELPADIMAVIKETAKQTAKAVVTEQDTQLEERRDRRLHNTQLLLKNYRKFKLHCTGAVYTDEEGDHDGSEEEEAIELLDMMMNKNRMAVVESIRMSCRRTKIIIKHIDNVLDMFRRLLDRHLKDESKEEQAEKAGVPDDPREPEKFLPVGVYDQFLELDRDAI